MALDGPSEGFSSSPNDVYDLVEGVWRLVPSDGVGPSLTLDVARGEHASVGDGLLQADASVRCREMLLEVDARGVSNDGTIEVRAAYLSVLSGSEAPWLTDDSARIEVSFQQGPPPTAEARLSVANATEGTYSLSGTKAPPGE